MVFLPAAERFYLCRTTPQTTSPALVEINSIPAENKQQGEFVFSLIITPAERPTEAHVPLWSAKAATDRSEH